MPSPSPTHEHSIATLRAIVYRISSTPPTQLPQVAAQISGLLWSCKHIFSQSQSSKSSNESANILHRFKTSLTTLLQDRTPEGRWAAVVLTKAAIEAGGVEILSKSTPWVRSLLAILKKNDPPTTRNLATITLTRLFMLTWDHSNLVREITTPALPTFISSCLGNIERDRCSTSELQTVLEAFATLIPRHPTIFRTHESQIRSLLLRILSSTSSATESSRYFSQHHQNAASRLLVLLHHCAPKQGSSGKWDESFRAAITAAHMTCDRLFRSVVEVWSSAADVQPSANPSILNAGEVQLSGEDALGLSGWNGIYAGSERSVALLGILRAHLETSTQTTVSIRIGLLVDLLTRLLDVTPPTSAAMTVKANAQIPKDEREALFAALPGIHVAALELVSSMLRCFGKAGQSLWQTLLAPIIDVYRFESWDDAVKLSTYTVVRLVLELAGPSLPKETVVELTPIIKECCEDLLPLHQNESTSNSTKANGLPASAGIDQKTSKLSTSRPSMNNDLDAAAAALLPAVASGINPVYVSRTLRQQIERTAILTRNKEALVACALNPSKKDVQTSPRITLLSFLAHEFPQIAEVEALLRPRLPPLSTKAASGGFEKVDDYDQDDKADDDNGALYRETSDHLHGDTHGTVEMSLSNLQGVNGESAFAQDEAQEEEDLYSATPPRELKDTPVAAHSMRSTSDTPDAIGLTTKRSAEEALSNEVSAKRLRAPPIAEALAGDAALPGPQTLSVEAQAPVTTFVSDTSASNVPTQKPVTLPAKALSDDTTRAMRGVGGYDSDSDFEMPPLTMEPDTEPEDEEEDEEE